MRFVYDRQCQPSCVRVIDSRHTSITWLHATLNLSLWLDSDAGLLPCAFRAFLFTRLTSAWFPIRSFMALTVYY